MQATSYFHAGKTIDLRRIVRRRYAMARLLWWASEATTALAVLALFMARFN
jgi:hypothetical protein